MLNRIYSLRPASVPVEALSKDVSGSVMAAANFHSENAVRPSVEVKWDQVRGREYIATRFISRGEVISFRSHDLSLVGLRRFLATFPNNSLAQPLCRIESQVIFTANPLVAVLSYEHLQSHCSMCFRQVDLPGSGSSAGCDACSLYTLCAVCSGLDASVEPGQTIKKTQGAGQDLQVHVLSGECKVLRQAEMVDTTTRLLLRLRCRFHQEEAGIASTPKEKDSNRSNMPQGFQGLAELERHADKTAVSAYKGYVRSVLSAGGFGTQEEQEDEKEYQEEIDRMVGWLQVILLTRFSELNSKH